MRYPSPSPHEIGCRNKIKKKNWVVHGSRWQSRKCWKKNAGIFILLFFLPVVFSPTLACLSFAGSTVLVLYYLRKAREKFLKITPSVWGLLVTFFFFSTLTVPSQLPFWKKKFADKIACENIRNSWTAAMSNLGQITSEKDTGLSI